LRSLQVIWAALVGTVLLYTLVAFWAMTSGIVDFSVFDPGIMPYVAGAALLLMLGGTVVRRVMVRRIDPEGDPNARLAAYMNASVLGLAVTEAGGMVLLTLGVLAGSPTWVLAGGLAAALLMATVRPSAKDLRPE
jgi:preprotein translocase subunit SecY